MVATFEILVIKHDRPPRGTRRPYRVFSETEGARWSWCFFTRAMTMSSGNYPLVNDVLSVGVSNYFRGRVQMAHPDHIISVDAADKMPVYEPVYPLTAGLTPKILHRVMRDALDRIPTLPEWIAPDLIAKMGWPDFATAMRTVPRPQPRRRSFTYQSGTITPCL